MSPRLSLVFFIFLGGACGSSSPIGEVTQGPWAHVSAGGRHSCAIDDRGTLFCWGNNRDGQLGIGRIGGALGAPTPIDLPTGSNTPRFTRVVAGDHHTCALDAEGVAYCWGRGLGVLGQVTEDAVGPAPVRIDPGLFGGRPIVDVALGYFATCVATGDGAVYCWGSSSGGVIGGVISADVLSPTKVSLPSSVPVVRLVGRTTEMCSFTSEGETFCWGSEAHLDEPSPPRSFGRTRDVALGDAWVCEVMTSGSAYCHGDGSSGQLGAGEAIPRSDTDVAVVTTGIPAFAGFSSITAGSSVTCAQTTTGGAYCWGNGELGALGDGTTTPAAFIPVAVDASALGSDERWVELSAGDSHVCGVTSAGHLRCWGSDAWGQLGNGGPVASGPGARPVDAHALHGGERVTQLATGLRHTCALTTEGRVFCWGHDLRGQLGTGAGFATSRTPAAISTASIVGDHHFVEVAAGNNHACALAGDGAAYCWGANAYGQLGVGTFVNEATPTPVDQSAITGDGKLAHLFAGANRTCAVATDGSGYCWGRSGAGLYEPATTPQRLDVSGLGGNTRLVQIDPDLSACGVTADGRGLCWGMGGSGQLGTVTQGSALTPTPIDLRQVTGSKVVIAMLAAWLHGCALMSDGAVYCFGERTEPLGLGYVPAADVFAPTAVDVTNGPDGGFVALAGSSQLTCGLDATGAPFCWGLDAFGVVDDTAATLDFDHAARVDLGEGAEALTQLGLGYSSACGVTPAGVAVCWGDNSHGQLGDGGDATYAARPASALSPR